MKYGLRWNGKINNYNNQFLFEIKDGNGKGKEYNFNGKLEYEGEFKNGERIKGKEYNDDKIIFKGEYLNGKRWNGIIKEYNYEDGIIYEGEFRNGEINGKGKEYEKENHRLIFEGEYLNGKKNGNGKEFFKSVEICEQFYHDIKK